MVLSQYNEVMDVFSVPLTNGSQVPVSRRSTGSSHDSGTGSSRLRTKATLKSFDDGKVKPYPEGSEKSLEGTDKQVDRTNMNKRRDGWMERFVAHLLSGCRNQSIWQVSLYQHHSHGGQSAAGPSPSSSYVFCPQAYGMMGAAVSRSFQQNVLASAKLGEDWWGR